MIEPALAKLRLDTRMTGRRDWTGKEELERELAALPDVSSKIAPREDALQTSTGAAGAEHAGEPR